MSHLCERMFTLSIAAVDNIRNAKINQKCRIKGVYCLVPKFAISDICLDVIIEFYAL